MKSIKIIIKETPLLGKLVIQISKLIRSYIKFPGSTSYWKKRYSKGGTSGSGSYNRLSEFKAEIINSFVKENNINSVIDLGCGDGNQLSLANYPKYIGVDVSPTIIQKCKEKYINDKTKIFLVYNYEISQNNISKFESELALSIDVIFHLVEDEVFNKYMNDLFRYTKKFVIIYSSNFNKDQVYHERDRKFTDWVELNQKKWRLIKKIDNKYKFDAKDLDNTSKCDFYFYENIA